MDHIFNLKLGSVSVFCFILVCQISQLDLVNAVELAMQVGAGREECFFEIAAANQTILIDYTVVATTQGEHDISFQLSDPQSRPLITEFHRAESSHRIPVNLPGLYKACFDNTFSHFSMKTVAFSFSLDFDENEANWDAYNHQNLQPEDVYEVQIQDIEASINRVRVSLSKVKASQDQFRLVELRDRSTAESNFERVNFWSLVNLLLLVFVGLLQVLLVKSLFDEKYDVRRYLKKFSK